MKRKKLLNPLFATDSYKHSHFGAVPEGTTLMYSHLTPRDNKRLLNDFPDHDGKVVIFGIQYLIQELLHRWDKGFFNRKWKKIEKETLEVLGHHLGFTKTDLVKFKELHDLGYLPLIIKSIQEGEVVDIGIPILTVQNIDERFFWLTNFIESYILNTLYPALNAATITREFAKLRDQYFDLTVSDHSAKGFHLHNFSYRGCQNHESAALIGAAHNLFTLGTDTLAGIALAQEYYGAKDVAYSITALEHSVQTLGINHFDSEDKLNGEYLQFHNLITEKYPTGLLAIISDSYDYWSVINTILPQLKNEIMNRDGKVIIRGDSGSALHNICGYNIKDITGQCEDVNAYSEALHPTDEVLLHNGTYYLVSWKDDHWEDYGLTEISEVEAKGTIEALWDIFGGTVNDKGFKELDSHIGTVYGDGLNYKVVKQVYERLAKKGFAINNICIALGAFSLSVVNTRDSLGLAIKASAATVNDVLVPVYKEPKTDLHKTSVKGLLTVHKDSCTGLYTVKEMVSPLEERKGELLIAYSPYDTPEVILDYQEIRDKLQLTCMSA